MRFIGIIYAGDTRIMSPDHKDKLIKNLVELVEMNITEMIPYLLNAVISNPQADKLKAIQFERKRAQHFLTNILPQKPDAAYGRFIEALAVTDQFHLLGLLEGKDISAFIKKGKNKV